MAGIIRNNLVKKGAPLWCARLSICSLIYIKASRLEYQNLTSSILLSISSYFDCIYAFCFSEGVTILPLYFRITDSFKPKTDTISQSDLDCEIKKRFIQKQLQNQEQLKEDWIQFLIENPQKEIIRELVYLYIRNKSELCINAAEMIEKNISHLSQVTNGSFIVRFIW